MEISQKIPKRKTQKPFGGENEMTELFSEKISVFGIAFRIEEVFWETNRSRFGSFTDRISSIVELFPNLEIDTIYQASYQQKWEDKFIRGKINFFEISQKKNNCFPPFLSLSLLFSFPSLSLLFPFSFPFYLQSWSRWEDSFRDLFDNHPIRWTPKQIHLGREGKRKRKKSAIFRTSNDDAINGSYISRTHLSSLGDHFRNRTIFCRKRKSEYLNFQKRKEKMDRFTF